MRQHDKYATWAVWLLFGAVIGWGWTLEWHGKAIDNLRAEAVSRGYAEWRHVDGKRDGEFVWIETEGEGQ